MRSPLFFPPYDHWMCIRAHGLMCCPVLSIAISIKVMVPCSAPPICCNGCDGCIPLRCVFLVLSSHTQVETECPREVPCPSRYSAHGIAAPAEVACEEAGTDTGVEGRSYCGSVLRPTDCPLGAFKSADTMVTRPSHPTEWGDPRTTGNISVYDI